MLNDLLCKHDSKGVLLDTNLLVLYLVGKYKRDYVTKFKRTNMYTVNDFDWLSEYVSKFAKIVVTPQVLAETWNFIEKIGEHRFVEFLEKTIPLLTLFEEEYIHKNIIMESDGFSYIGITDMSVIQAGKKLDCLVLTDDLRAYSHFLQFEVSTININHLRQI